MVFPYGFPYGSQELLRPEGEAPGTSQRGAALDAATEQLQLLGAAKAALEQRPSHTEGVEAAVGGTTWKGRFIYYTYMVSSIICLHVCIYIYMYIEMLYTLYQSFLQYVEYTYVVKMIKTSINIYYCI